MKKIFLVLLTLLLTGCSANVDVNIHKDYSVTEKISIFENKENIDVENSSYEQYVSDFKEFVIQNYNLYGYKYNSTFTDNTISGTAIKKYDDICDYFKNSPSITNFFSNVSCVHKSGYYNIIASSNYFKCDNNCIENPDIDNISLNLTLSQKVIEGKGDEKNGNKDTWRFSNDSDNKFNLKIRENIINKAVNNTSDTTIKMLLVILLIIIVISIFSYVFYKKYKKNRIEY